MSPIVKVEVWATTYDKLQSAAQRKFDGLAVPDANEWTVEVVRIDPEVEMSDGTVVLWHADVEARMGTR